MLYSPIDIIIIQLIYALILSKTIKLQFNSHLSLNLSTRKSEVVKIGNKSEEEIFDKKVDGLHSKTLSKRIPENKSLLQSRNNLEEEKVFQGKFDNMVIDTNFSDLRGSPAEEEE